MKSAAAMAEEEDRPVASTPTLASRPAPTPKVMASTADDEDDLSYFQKLANE